MAQTDTVAGAELGGTKSIAIIAIDGAIVARQHFVTSTPEDTLIPLAAWLAEREPTGGFAGLGVASFGPAQIHPGDRNFGHIAITPKSSWSGASVIGPLAARLNCPVAFDTDVNAAALAEYRWGAAKACSSVAYVTIGTGVGVGVLINGQPVHGALHPEAGHLSLRRAPGDRFAGGCSFHGDCVEGLLSGPALATRLGEAPENVVSDDRRWDAPAHDLAQFLTSLILVLSPERILIGGGVGLGAPHLLSAALQLIPPMLAGYLPDLDADRLAAMIVPAGLGADAGPLGAIALALDAAEKGRSAQVR